MWGQEMLLQYPPGYLWVLGCLLEASLLTTDPGALYHLPFQPCGFTWGDLVYLTVAPGGDNSRPLRDEEPCPSGCQVLCQVWGWGLCLHLRRGRRAGRLGSIPEPCKAVLCLA